MRHSHGTYVHRGDAVRRRKRFRRGLLLVGFAVATVLAFTSRNPQPATAEAASTGGSTFTFGFSGENDRLRNQLETAKGELRLVRAQFERADRILKYSARYKIPSDLAGKVFDVALAEGIDPELAFRLVKLESDFNPRAVSGAGAVGLTQLMPATARFFEKDIDQRGLYDANTNLRIGFRFLRSLMDRYKGDASMALLVYNRGEVAVNQDVAMGLNPSNGYDTHLMKGYKGPAIIQ